jgi:transcriptional regulator with PAS, ATPase and Fis domain
MQLIHSKLAKYDNDTARVARELDIGKSTIYRLLKEEKEAMQKQRENMG